MLSSLLSKQSTQYYSTKIVRSDGISSRIFSDGLRKRLEIYGQGSIPTIIISRPDLGVNWLLMLDGEQYQEAPFNDQYGTFDPDSMLEWQVEGLESIEDVSYRGLYKFTESVWVYELSYVDPNIGFHRRSVTFDKTGSKNLTVDCFSLSPEPTDPKMFELPQGYNKEPE